MHGNGATAHIADHLTEMIGIYPITPASPLENPYQD
jgi:pyruvate/2-oxoacid:ferredoxin oxidoreductase alpha subunit